MKRVFLFASIKKTHSRYLGQEEIQMCGKKLWKKEVKRLDKENTRVGKFRGAD